MFKYLPLATALPFLLPIFRSHRLSPDTMSQLLGNASLPSPSAMDVLPQGPPSMACPQFPLTHVLWGCWAAPRAPGSACAQPAGPHGTFPVAGSPRPGSCGNTVERSTRTHTPSEQLSVRGLAAAVLRKEAIFLWAAEALPALMAACWVTVQRNRRPREAGFPTSRSQDRLVPEARVGAGGPGPGP